MSIEKTEKWHFGSPKMVGRYLKTPFLATRRPKMKKRRVHCFLKLLKIKENAKSKFWFSTFFDPPPPEPNSRPKSAFYFMNFFLSGQNNMSPLKRNIQIQSPSLSDLTPTPLPSNIRVNWTPPYPSGGPKYIFWVGLCEIWPNKAKNQHNFALVG